MTPDPANARASASDRINATPAKMLRSKPNRAGAWLLNAAQAHPLRTLAIAGVLIFSLLLLGPAFLLGIRHGFSNRAIDKTKTEAAAEKTAADRERIDAGQIEIGRKAEDLNRDQSLTPKRKQAAANLEAASRRRKAAEDLYEKNRNARRIPDLDDLALRRRNCSDLAELYPGERFAGCN